MRNVRIENAIERHKERSSKIKKEKPSKQLTKRRKKEETFVNKRVLEQSKSQGRPTSERVNQKIEFFRRKK